MINPYSLLVCCVAGSGQCAAAHLYSHSLLFLQLCCVCDIVLQAVASVLGEVKEDRVSERPSSGGQYLSVKIGPVVVSNPDQVRHSKCIEGFSQIDVTYVVHGLASYLPTLLT